MKTSFYSEEELKEIGFARVGHDVMISRKASIYGASSMVIGNHVRIDDFCVLSGKITIGNYVHVAVMTALFGGTAGITFEDYTGISSRCAVYATSDDYSGDYMTNPTVPPQYTHVVDAPVLIKKHSIIGTGSTIMQGVTLEEGTALCAMTFATKDTKPWGIYMGYQCVRVKDRSKGLLDMDIKDMDTMELEESVK